MSPLHRLPLRQAPRLTTTTFSSSFSAPKYARRISALASQLQLNRTASASIPPVTIAISSYRAMASIPQTMKGVIIEKTGGVEVLQHKTDLPIPKPEAGEVLVKNDFVGVNFIDTYFRSGLYPAPSFPYILGREAEGTIVATGSPSSSGGDLHGLKEGDKVVWMATGAYAEYTAVPASKVVKVPGSLPAKVGAASLLQGLTALTLIREAHAVQKGDWVLVHAAAGGTGQWLCKLLRSVGAHTIATASTPEKLALAKGAGAEHVVNYTTEDVRARVMQLTSDRGVVAVFDGVGKSTFDLSLSCLARKGSMLSFGNASGAVEPLAISRLSAKNVRLMRPTLFNFIAERDELEGYTKELFDMIVKDGLEPAVHEVYPLSEVGRAQSDLEGRKTTGKLLLDPSK